MVKSPDTKSRAKIAALAVLALLASLSLPAIPAVGQTSNSIPVSIIVVESAAKAEEMLDQLKRGGDFATLAREQSISATARDGGFIGRLDPETLRVELREAVKGIAAGQVTGSVHIPEGFAILKILRASEVTTGATTSSRELAPLLATGAVKYTLNVAGGEEAEAILRALPELQASSQDLSASCRARAPALERARAGLAQKLESANSSNAETSPAEKIKMYYTEAQLYAYQGDMEKAIALWQDAYQIVQTSVPRLIPPIEETLGIAYLHQSEMKNDVYLDPGDKCIFPMDSSARFAVPEYSQKAVEYFLNYLKQDPQSLEVRWLLNLSYMTLGQYPNGVPAPYLIPPSAFASKENIAHFKDVAPATGLNLVSLAGGVIVDDFDNDGLLDVVISSMDPCEPLRFFHNNGDGTFTDRTVQAKLGDQLGGLNILQADYNNDGCMDILVLRGGWEYPVRRSLLRNNCDGTFTDVTRESGLAEPATSTQSAVWADIDNDGYLDLFVANERGSNQLFRNQGNGTFQDISHSAGIDQSAFSKAVAAADYDNDGFVDLYVSNFSSANFLYHNNHNGTFTEVAQAAGVQEPRGSFSTWFFDYDNDGWPDLLVNSYYQSDEEVMRTYLGLPHNAETMKLYKNMRDGTFKDVTAKVGLDKVFMPMGANFGDVDNDGFPDIYLGNGSPSYGSLIPHTLLRNHDGKYFADITASSGTGELHKGHGIAFADLDRRGYEDIVAEVGGMTPGDRHALRVFENPGNHNDWINVHLVGVKTNRAAIGAQIKLTVENHGKQIRAIYRTVGSGGSFGASPLEQHIGLGADARIVNLEVLWPASKTHQSFAGIQKNQFIEIKEFSSTVTKLDRKPFRLGGAKPSPAALPSTDRGSK